MATTYTDNGGGAANGSDLEFTFTFPVIQTEDVKVALNNIVQATTKYAVNLSSNPTKITFNNTSITSSLQETSGAPKSGVSVRVFRQTTVGKTNGDEDPKAVFAAGSSIRAIDLNANQEQALYAIHELQDQPITDADLGVGAVTSAAIADGTIATVDIADSAITTAKINADAITGAKIADDQINSEHYVDGSIDTQHIADSQITSVKIADGTIVAGDLASNAVTTAKITDANVTTAKIADSNVTTAKIANSNVTTAKIADSNVTTAKIADSNVTTAKIAADNITSALIADDQINSEHYVDGSIDTQHIADAQITSAKLAANCVSTANIIDGAIATADIGDNQITTAKINADAVNGTKIADDSINSEHYVDGSIDTAHIAGAQVTDAKLASNSVTTSKITDANVTTVKVADANITLAKLASDLKQTTISNSDTQLPTSGAVVDYVAAQIAPIGGLEVIATEVAFPNTQPSAGVVISISDAGGVVVSGTSSNTGRTVGGSTVTINGFPSTLTGETLVAGVGLMVSSTGSGQVYNYHKLLAKEADVKQLSDDINDFASRYRVGSSNPTSSLDNGDLFFNTGSSKLLVYNGTASAWEETQSVGNFFINTISSYSGTGGNSASFNGSAYRFVLSSPGLNAEQHIVSINGVIQKPNSGTSQPSEGFAIDGSSIIFSSAPVSGADFFIITIGAAVSIGTPSNNTVSTDVLTSGAVTTAKIADQAVTLAKLPHGDGSSNGKFLRANNGADPTFESVITDLVGDSSPQLGGDLASNGNDIDFADGDKAIFGTGEDLEIYHSNNESFIDDKGSGNLFIRSNGAGIHFKKHGTTETLATFNTDGNCELYHDNQKNFETVSGGCSVNGALSVSNGISLPDGKPLKFGNNDDLQIQHNGFASYINNNAGDLYLRNDNANDNANIILQARDGENSIVCHDDGEVAIYHDNVKTVETGDSQLKIYGRSGINSTLYLISDEGGDAGESWRMMANGENSDPIWTLTNNPDGNWEKSIQATGNAGVMLFWNNGVRFQTTNAGVTISGNQEVNGSCYPGSNNSYDLGTTSYRWRNIYTNDLNLSNEGSSNDVDGSWGNWTIQEGESDLFLKNNRSGKKYKFNLTEVS